MIRYYLVIRDTTVEKDMSTKKKIGFLRSSNISHISPLSDNFKLNVVNNILKSFSNDLKVNDSDKSAIESHGLTILCQTDRHLTFAPDLENVNRQIWIYDIEHPDNNFLKVMIRDKKISDITN